MEDPATQRTGRSFWRGFPRPQPWCVLIFVVLIVIIVVWCRPCCEDEPDPASGEPGISGGAFEDVIETPYATHEVVALIDGTQSGCLKDFPSGPFLSKSVGLGNFTSGCGTEPASAVLFSKDRRARFLDPGWTTSYDKVLESPATSVVDDAPVVVRLRIWRGVTQEEGSSSDLSLDDFLDAIKADLAVVNDIFNQNRSGLLFEFQVDEVVDLKTDLDTGDFYAYCKDFLESSTPPSYAGVALDPQYLEVIFVAGGALAGNTCDRNGDDAPDGVILLNFFKRLDATVLAHELGHALGLMGQVGHPVTGDSTYTGFDEKNVMWPYWEATLPKERDHFTLGQNYRMNAAENSWFVLRHIPPVPWKVACQVEHHTDYPCPHLRQELVDLP